MARDLTTGSPMRLIWSFALPTLFGMLFQQFYNMMDTMIVGQLLGASALASVGSTSSINFFVIGFCMGVCNGFAIPVAQRMGAGDYSQMRRCVANAGWLSALFAVVLTVFTGLFCRTILTVMRTPEDIFDGAYWYILIIFLGIPTTFLYNLLAAVIRALGDSKTPVYFLAISSVLNIALDLLLILYCHAGVAGAALATVISQGVSGLACLVFSLWLEGRLPMTPGLFPPLLLPAGLTTLFCGLLLVVGRATALSQVMGYLVAENGIFLLGIPLMTAGAVWFELTLLLDIFVAVFVMGIAINHISHTFESIDVGFHDLRD